MSLRVNLCGEVKGETPEAAAKASLKRASTFLKRDVGVARIRHETG
jgi:hypothetical protein